MKKALLLSTSLTTCALLMASGSHMAWANPEGGIVTSGQASIETSGKQVDIRQSSDRAVIDWRSFNINQDETTNFHQPSSSSLTVNRINDSNPSKILGNLNANGNIVLINQAGISFGKDAVVDVNSLVATTADISDTDAMAGHLNFQSTGVGNAAIINEGTITAKEAGLVGLVAPRVENNGVITAKLGKVHLASGDKFTLDLYGDGAINITASDAVQNQIISHNGKIQAEGGVVQITAAAGAQLLSSVVVLDGEINAPSAVEKNGRIIISGHDETSVSITGKLDVNGRTGGHVSVTGKNILQQGQISANGTNGQGGEVNISFKKAYIDSQNGKVEARGHNGQGGTIAVKGDSSSTAFVSGKYDSSSTTHKGGKAQITAEQGDLKLFGATVRADGATGGGAIHIGGEYQGGGTLGHANTTGINYATILSADATHTGKGGDVIVWSDDTTKFAGTVQARGGINGGDGGLIELSSKDTLLISDAAKTEANARKTGYQAGRLLLDPKNITIATGGIEGGISYFELTDPHPDAGFFGGYEWEVLANGNILVTDKENDFMATNAGAVYMFDGATGGLISTLTGTQTNDHVGEDGFMLLSNGNFVVKSRYWNNGGMADVGAVTWGNGTTGISGTVSAANSFIGSYAGQQLYNTVALTNGNYLITDLYYRNGGLNNLGAVAWADGSMAKTGSISAATALVGSRQGDSIGTNNIWALPNGNYVILSPFWNNGTIVDAGAITWGNGTTGVTGAISAANSLIGSSAYDYLGTDQWSNRYMGTLQNGNLIFGSPHWDNGGQTDVGAITFMNVTTGSFGVVSSANSLIGSTTNDNVGYGIYGTWEDRSSFIDLGNGKFVVSNSMWDNGSVIDAGAVTMGSTTTGISGVISSANSLVGGTDYDMVGNGSGGSAGLRALGNGNFIILSPDWDSTLVDVGATTWVDGSIASLSGYITTANSLHGTTEGDKVGSMDALILSNGNYIVGSTMWDHGAIVDAGAATWVNGTTGLSGAVSLSNSVVGSSEYDSVGYALELDSGNFVLVSPDWDDGATANVGAVTWVSGTTGMTGYVNNMNSIVGTTLEDRIGSSGVASVGNNKFLILSPQWDNGLIEDSGAITWLDEAFGTSGTVNQSNSLYADTAFSGVGGTGIINLSNGNYLVRNEYWINHDGFSVGAVTWGNGDTGVFGAVSANNSLVGQTDGDWIGAYGITLLTNGNYLVHSAAWDNGALVDAGALTWGSGMTGVSGYVSSANSVIGSYANDQIGWQDWGETTVTSTGDYVLHAIYWNNSRGAVRVIDGTNGTFGEISSYNSILGSDPSSMMWPGYKNNEDEVNGRYVFADGMGQKVYSVDLNTNFIGDYNSYGDTSGASITLSPDFLTNVLNSGTAITLQANNDITINNDIIVNNNFGDGGALTFQAGRSIFVNADIVTDNGDINLFANEDLATGVVDAHRDAGGASITMASGTILDAGTGNINIRLDDGTGKTNRGADAITLRDLNANEIFVRNHNVGGLVWTRGGTITANAAGNALTIVSAGTFNFGAATLDTPNGRWLVYSNDPSNDTITGLSYDFRRFSCTYGGSCPTLGAGNGLLYTLSPTLTITPDAVGAISYGDNAPNLTGYGYAVSGYLGADSGDDVLGGSLNGSTTYTAGSNVGTYNINHSSGSLTSEMGYVFNYANNSSAITVNRKNITADFTAPLTKTYGNANPTLTNSHFTFNGLVGSDSGSLFTSITSDFGMTPVNANTDIGTYTIGAIIGSTTNYNVTVNNSTLQINPRALNVVTNATSKILPAADPVFTGSHNLTAHDAALISWLYAPVGYGGLDGTYVIDATATDMSGRLANYTRTNTYGNFIVYPAGTVIAPPEPVAPSMPNTVTYMSLGGFLRDAQNANSQSNTTQEQNSADEKELHIELTTVTEDGLSEEVSEQDNSLIKIHPKLKSFLTNPFAMIVN